MKPIRAVMHLVAAICIAAALVSVHGSVRAQDANSSSGSGPEGAYVSVACDAAAEPSTTICHFDLSGLDDASPQAFTMPSSLFCAAVVAIGRADWSDSGIRLSISNTGSSTNTITFGGAVSAVAGGTSYPVETDAGTLDVGGDSLSCDPPNSGDSTTDQTDEESTPDLALAEQGIDGALVSAEIEASDVDDADATPAADDSSTASQVTISATVYDCDVEPGAATLPTADCSVAESVDIDVVADGVSVGTSTTDSDGFSSASVADGSLVELTEDRSTIPTGYSPLGDGFASFTASEGASVVFVNLKDELLGRVQVANCSLFTSGEPGTEFRVIEPNSFQIAAENPCIATFGSIFTITGENLPADGVVAVTGDDGAWRGFLPVGTYTVRNANGDSVEIDVVADEIVVVIAFDYVPGPQGTLVFERWLCEGAPASASIQLLVDAPDPLDGCDRAEGTVDIESDGDSAPIELGSDGSASVVLAVGEYDVVDDTTGESAEVTVQEGVTSYVLITEVKPADDGTSGGSTGGDDTSGGSTDGGGDPSGEGSGDTSGDGTGETDGATDGAADDQSDDSSDLNGGDVTTLPETGTGPIWLNGAGFSPAGIAAILLALSIVTIGAWRQSTAKRSV